MVLSAATQFLDIPLAIILFASGLYLLITRKKFTTAREEKVHRREISKERAVRHVRILNASMIILLLAGVGIIGLKFTGN